MNEIIMKKTAEWLGGNLMSRPRKKLKGLQKENEGELTDAFYRSP